MYFNLLLFLNYFFQIISIQDSIIFQEKINNDQIATDQQALLRGRGLTVYARPYHGDKVNIWYKINSGGVEIWTQTTYLQPPNSANMMSDQFGGAVQSNPLLNVNFFFNADLRQNHIAGNVLIVGAALTDGLYSNTGAAYIFTGVWSKWSLQQTLTLDTQNENDMFGTSVAFNQVSMSEAAITCLGCDPEQTGFVNSSATYIYTSKPPYHNQWTQQQILYPRNPNHRYIGYGLVMDRDLLLISGSTRQSLATDLAKPPASQGGAASFKYMGRQVVIYLYQRSLETKLWTEQQILEGASTYTTNLYYAIEDETVLTSNGANAGWLFGFLNVYYPNTERYDPKAKSQNFNNLNSHDHSNNINKDFITTDYVKPRPRTPQWSLQQVLTDPQRGIDGGFGAFFDITGNSMVVLRALSGGDSTYGPSSNAMYIYERPTINGKWSAQQVFVFDYDAAYLNPPTWYGNIITVSDTNKNIQFYSLATEWNCLTIRLEDSFGDGWDNAALFAETPDGTIETYKPYCDSDNPLEFRFCPLTGNEVGLYKFYIDNAAKSKFYWEIQWQIYEEKTGQWFRGDHKTRMDFYWEPDTRDFSHRAIVHNIPLNITCINNCKSRPTPKPTPSDYDIPKRLLKGDNTHVPTHTPAPTLSQTSNVVWQYLTMTGSSWFSSFHHGVNYYISDLEGRKLLSTGTKCDEFATQNCWQTLPDGDYVLRITGDLNVQSVTRSWSFCGRTGSISEMLVFTISNGECDAIEAYTRSTYCLNKLSTVALVDVIFLVSAPSINTLTLQDQNDIVTSLSYVFPEITSNDIHIINTSPDSNGIILEVQFIIPVSAYGYDADDLSSIKQTYETFVSKLYNEIATNHIKEILTSTSHQSDLTKVTNVNIYETKLKANDIKPLSTTNTDSSSIDTIITFEPPIHTIPYHDEKENEISWEYILELCTIYTTSAVGYLIFGALLVLSVYSVHTYIQHRRQNYPTVQTLNEIDNKNNNSNNNENNNNNNNSLWSKINEKRIQLEVGVVSFLDDIGDIVVDVIYPPEDEFQSN